MHINEYDSPIPVADSQMSNRNNVSSDVMAIRKSSKSTQQNVNLGINIPFADDAANISLGMSFAWGQHKTESDYLDLNGDGYPDIIGSKKIQYTMPWGGLGEPERIADKYDNPDWHLSSNKTFTSGNSGGLSGQFAQMVKTNNSVNCAKYILKSNSSISDSQGSSECIQNYTDMNGDGLPDVVRIIKDTAYIAYNVGYGFTTPIVSPWKIPAINKSHSSTTSSSSEYDDIFELPSTIFGKKSFYEHSLSLGTSRSFSTDMSNVMLADVNGDGLVDILQENENSEYYVIYNYGSEFCPSSYLIANAIDRRISQQTDSSASVTAGFAFGLNKFGVSVNGGGDESSTISDKAFIDMNGDGVPDIVTLAGNGVSVKYNNARKTNMLRRITNSSGSTIDIDYTLSDNVRNSPHRMWQMTSVTIKDSSAVEVTASIQSHIPTAIRITTGWNVSSTATILSQKFTTDRK